MKTRTSITSKRRRVPPPVKPVIQPVVAPSPRRKSRNTMNSPKKRQRVENEQTGPNKRLRVDQSSKQPSHQSLKQTSKQSINQTNSQSINNPDELMDPKLIQQINSIKQIFQQPVSPVFIQLNREEQSNTESDDLVDLFGLGIQQYAAEADEERLLAQSNNQSNNQQSNNHDSIPILQPISDDSPIDEAIEQSTASESQSSHCHTKPRSVNQSNNQSNNPSNSRFFSQAINPSIIQTAKFVECAEFIPPSDWRENSFTLKMGSSSHITNSINNGNNQTESNNQSNNQSNNHVPTQFEPNVAWLPVDLVRPTGFTQLESNARRGRKFLIGRKGGKRSKTDEDDDDHMLCKCRFRTAEMEAAAEAAIRDRKRRIDAGERVKPLTAKEEEELATVWNCGEGCLNSAVLIECTDSTCALPDPKMCKNRHFARGDTGIAEAFRTDLKGWGLRAKKAVPAGSFVLEYVGEVIDKDEVSRRIAAENTRAARILANRAKGHATALAQSVNANYYFMTVNEDWIIDAKERGNDARFINHSCNPNCIIEKWNVDGEMRVAIFTTRSVEAGKELTIDYQYDRINLERQPCYCAEENCAKWIGGEKKVVAGGLSDKKRAAEDAKTEARRVAGEKKVIQQQSIESICAVCGEGDDESPLRTCDAKCNGWGCPRVYHYECIGMIDNGKRYSWYCPWHYCHGLRATNQETSDMEDNDEENKNDDGHDHDKPERVTRNCHRRAHLQCVSCTLAWCNECSGSEHVDKTWRPVEQTDVLRVINQSRRPWLEPNTENSRIHFVVCQSCQKQPLALFNEERAKFRSTQPSAQQIPNEEDFMNQSVEHYHSNNVSDEEMKEGNDDEWCSENEM